jgi:muramidase (phage lysozyme)
VAVTLAPALKSFLDLISFSEGADYDTIVTGVVGPATFTDYSDHPFAPQFHRPPVIVRRLPLLESTASGRYQILYRWWLVYKAQLKLADFSPASQDAYAIEQLRERGAIALIGAGDIQAAITACSDIWASFPGNQYKQGSKSMVVLLDKFQELSAQSGPT